MRSSYTRTIHSAVYPKSLSETDKSILDIANKLKGLIANNFVFQNNRQLVFEL
jgi:hypothetical protein